MDIEIVLVEGLSIEMTTHTRNCKPLTYMCSILGCTVGKSYMVCARAALQLLSNKTALITISPSSATVLPVPAFLYTVDIHRIEP